jgi:hypothetical protein
MSVEIKDNLQSSQDLRAAVIRNIASDAGLTFAEITALSKMSAVEYNKSRVSDTEDNGDENLAKVLNQRYEELDNQWNTLYNSTSYESARGKLREWESQNGFIFSNFDENVQDGAELLSMLIDGLDQQETEALAIFNECMILQSAVLKGRDEVIGPRLIKLADDLFNKDATKSARRKVVSFYGGEDL